MSLTSKVPASVPSLFHSSFPPLPSLAVKKSVPFTSVSGDGKEPIAPGEMSRTSTVPAAVASLFQSSTPFVPSFAWKKRRSVHVGEKRRRGADRTGRDVADEHGASRRPVAFQSSIPWMASPALKKSTPSTSTSSSGDLISGRESDVFDEVRLVLARCGIGAQCDQRAEQDHAADTRGRTSYMPTREIRTGAYASNHLGVREEAGM